MISLVDRVSDEAHFTDLVNIAFFFSDLANNFTNFEKAKLEDDLRVIKEENLPNLRTNLTSFKAAVTTFCTGQSVPLDCSEIEALLSQLVIDDSDIPDADLSGFNIANIDDLNDLKGKVQDALNDLESFGENFISDQSEEIRNVLNDVKNEVRENTQEIIEEIKDFSIKKQIDYDSIKNDLKDIEAYLEPLYYALVAFGGFLR